MQRVVIFLLICSYPSMLFGQTDSLAIKQFIREQSGVLAGNKMHGRGFVKHGRVRASKYIRKKFMEYGLQPVPTMDSYAQEYTFPVNTFPGRMKLEINGRELQPGADYLIDASSPAFKTKNLSAEVVDMGGINDIPGLKTSLGQFDGQHAYILAHTDSMCKALKINEEELAAVLPEGVYLLPEATKLTWTVSTTTNRATVFYVRAAAIPNEAKKITIKVKAVFIPGSQNENLVAEVPGEIKDTFIAFTGHYDHLGMMGAHAIFRGASDNASGISMLLYLANYFSAHPQRYSILFIAFSGEEPGLLGSEYFVAHPTVPLANIKFLTNIDIMGDATDGVTVVNATEYPNQFGLLQNINDQNKYIPIIKSRGKAHNSDHWHFTEAGVPSFFIYSNGGKGFYHDIYDKPAELTLNHVAGVPRLLIDFVKELR